MLLATSIPWWGAPLFTLLGGVLGSGATQYVTIWNEGRRSRQARELALLELERETAVKLIIAIDGHAKTMIETGEVPDDSKVLREWNKLNVYVQDGRIILAARSYMQIWKQIEDMVRAGKPYLSFQIKFYAARRNPWNSVRASQGKQPLPDEDAIQAVRDIFDLEGYTIHRDPETPGGG